MSDQTNDGSPQTDVSLGDLTQMGSTGNVSNAITNNIYGFNHRQMPNPIPINKDHYGLTFFTRPQLNFNSSNIRNVRTLLPLITEQEMSYQRVIRCTLDPRLIAGWGSSSNEGLKCPLMDNKQAFIPLLTNHLVSISGWQDIIVPTFSAREGAYKEGYSMVDGTALNYTTYDIVANFRNSRGDPITNLFYYWSHYSTHVFEGRIIPYPDFIVSNSIDYNTRIYRLVLDSNKRFVQKIAATGASFPVAVPIGSSFDYSNDKPYNDSNSEISIPFRSMGAIYNDDILIFAFNKTVSIFNPDMREDARNGNMVLVPREYLELFNNRGYPYIDPDTYELQWWVDRSTFDSRMSALDSFNQSFVNVNNLNA